METKTKEQVLNEIDKYIISWRIVTTFDRIDLMKFISQALDQLQPSKCELDDERANEIMKSKCCNADVRVAGKTTHYYVCEKCGKDCDV